MNKVETAEIIAQLHGVPLLKGDAFGPGSCGQGGRKLSSGGGFYAAGVVLPAIDAHGLRGSNETQGIINTDDFRTRPGQFKCRPADGTPEVQPPVPRSVINERANRPHREMQRVQRTKRPGHDLRVTAIMKKQILVEEAGGFVEAGHGPQ